MGGFGSEYDLEKAGFSNAGGDVLTDEDRLKMVRPYMWDNLSSAEKIEVLLAEYNSVDLSEAEESLRKDEKIKPVDWVPVRNSVFTVLNMNGTPEITLDDERLERLENRKEIKRRARNIQEIKHQRLMREDPEYAEEQKIMQNLQFSLSNESAQGVPFLINPYNDEI